jgi:hypothetical protein
MRAHCGSSFRLTWGSCLLGGALLAIWAAGVRDAILGGLEPGYVLSDVAYPYPLAAVFWTCLLITAEAGALFAILRPASFSQRPGRAVIAVAILVPVCFGEYLLRATDQAGYYYSNGFFLRTALALSLIAACLGFAVRVRIHSHGP